MYAPKEYWTRLAEGIPFDDVGFAPVLHPTAPSWFNQLIDKLQLRAIRRALALANVPTGAHVLDVGCGTGRWVRRYQGIGLHVTGVDATPAMLSLAREYGTVSPLVVGEAHRLPFADAEFDCVSDITVTQHIPTCLQPKALGEMLRVLRPGGHLILMELIRGEGVHIFPRTPRDWIAQTASHGAELVGWFGQEYLLFDRLFVHLAQMMSGKNVIPASAMAPFAGVSSQHSSAARRIYWRLRHITAPLSAWADRLAETICPAGVATHGVFVFRK